MMRSRTAAALMRLKEMDRKYNIKRNEATRAQSGNVSTDTSLEVTPREPRADSRKSPDVLATANTLDIGDTDDGPGSKVIQVSLKPRAPSSASNDVSSDRSGPRKKSRGDTAEDLVPEDEPLVRLREETPSIIKESLGRPSDPLPSVRSISSESKSKSKQKSAGSMDQPKSSDESSVATILSKPSGVSEIISEAGRSVQEFSTGKRDGKAADADERITEASVRSLREDVEEDTIEEAIRTSGEVDSELSRTSERNDDVSVGSFREEQKIEYESDTFEQASSSTGSSIFVDDGSKEALRDDSIRSGVKQIMITVHMQPASAKKTAVDDSPEETTLKEKKIIELVPPKIVQSTSECEIGLDEELSNYVRTTENVEELIPISLLKMSKQTTPRKHPRRGRKPRKNENNESPEASDQERSARHSVKSFSSATIETANQEKQKENFEDESSKKEDAAHEEQEADEHAEDGDTASTSSEKLLRETPKTSDVTWTLRNLNRDAIDAIARRHRFPKDTKKCGTVVKLPSAKCEAPDSRTGSLDNLKDSSPDQKKRKGTSKRPSKAPKTRKTPNRTKLEEKQSRFDCRHARKLRKQAAVLRQQQEREDIRNYLLEMEHTRLEYGIGDPGRTSKLGGFKPLEFPNIVAFEKPDPTNESLKSTDEMTGLQERISSIRQWMKDQYTLYRDYSCLAKTVNAKYVPASLEDAKRTIRQLQKVTIKSR